MSFRDHFSRQAAEYARYRPTYPAALFEVLAGLAPARDLAWDCGTGSGQAARMLADHFQRVIGTDASADQIANALPHERVEYRVEPAEETSLLPGSVDLIAVGTAVHWFDFDEFYAEVRRVGRPGAILAVWTYHLVSIAPAVDRYTERYYRDILGSYWPERIDYLDKGYRTLPFPFDEIAPPDIKMETQWTLDHLIGFLASWSAVKSYLEEHGRHPLDEIVDGLRESWGDPARLRKAIWPLHFRIGRLSNQ